MTVFCSNCGTPDNEGSKFCGNCGTALDQTQQANQSVPASPATVNYQAPVQQGYQEQWYPPQEGRPTGITVLAILTALGILGTTLGLPAVFQYGALSGILTLMGYGLSIGVFYAMWYMKKWGVKYIFAAEIAGIGISAIDIFIVTPTVIRQQFMDLGYEGDELELVTQVALGFSEFLFIFGVVLTILILGYVNSKKHLFVN
ncbi:MAG: zinc ribbon domain-containing protein [Candidatus Kariarchaeaceae archaeon]|jgi:hypothetical protein